jgi:flagellar motility protein MotE (MotC chaperone)
MMNQTARYLAVFGGSMLLLLMVAVGLAFLRPDMFGQSPASVTPPLPLSAASVRTDTTAAVPSPAVTAVAAQETPAQPAAVDSAGLLWKELQITRAELLQRTMELQAERRQADSLRTMRSAAAKLLNAMNAEDAARILGNVTDEEARDILMMISTRHAGKILSALDPGRAATILR